MDKQAFELIHDAKHNVKELIAADPPKAGDVETPQYQRRAPKRPIQRLKDQPEQPRSED